MTGVCLSRPIALHIPGVRFDPHNPELLSILVYELNSSGDLVSLFHLFSIDERNTVNDLGEVREAA